MNKRQSHTECNHAGNKPARAACRRKRLTADTAKVVGLTFTFVLGARAQGWGNMVTELAFYKIAQEYGIEVFDPELAKKMARERAEEEGLLDVLGPDVRPEKDIK